MVANGDSEALRSTTRLMDYLAEVTAAGERYPLRDVLADERGVPELIIWLGALPQAVRLVTNPADGVLLRLRPPLPVSQPTPPIGLEGWIDPASDDRGVQLPRLVGVGPLDENGQLRTPPPAAVVRDFEAWLTRLRAWIQAQELYERRLHLYTHLEQAAKTLEQHDDEFEFVLAAGLLRWQAPDGERIRRHLLVEAVEPRLDRATAEVTVTLISGRRRLEDSEILRDQEGYVPDRGRPARDAVEEAGMSSLDPAVLRPLQEFLSLSLSTAVELDDDVPADIPSLPTAPRLSASPALILRPRGRALLADAYRKIAADLRKPDAQVPVALAELVVDTERSQREAWLRQQGAAAGNVLGDDPLFPRPTNDEQRQVMEVLRSETGVVVQGPPGTGKTHTIANLVSALLARGQRVLVTSQKDQALRVLREYIPPELRQLCVLLAGGSKDVARELEQGLDALSDAIASPDTAGLGRRIESLRRQRRELLSRSAELNEHIRQLRETETINYGPMVPGFDPDRYRGTLAEIARELRRDEDNYGWFPHLTVDVPDQAPLSSAAATELLKLLRTDTPERRSRSNQRIPTPGDVPPLGVVTERFGAERRAEARIANPANEHVVDLAAAKPEALQGCLKFRAEIHEILARLGLEADSGARGRHWVRRAVDDHLTGHNLGFWTHVIELDGAAERLQKGVRSPGATMVVELTTPVSEIGIGPANGMLAAAEALHGYLARGGRLRTSRYRPPSPEQRRASRLMEIVRVNGEPPTTAEEVAAAARHLEAEVAAARLAKRWAEVDVIVPASHLHAVLTELQTLDSLLRDVRRLADLYTHVVELLRWGGQSVRISSLEIFRYLLDITPAALDYREFMATRAACSELRRHVDQWSGQASACPEVSLLLNAVDNRDADAYQRGLDALQAARTEQLAHRRQVELAQHLGVAHPRLLAWLAESATDPAWDARLDDLPAAWAWSKAYQRARQGRTVDQEHRLAQEFDEVETTINSLTAQLAGAEAMRACVERMSDAHTRALRSYRELMGKIGAGAGRKTGVFRKGARSAMDKAKGAVPAWVVPLPNLLENLAAERNSFDVVIVDEASQVGMEYLLLLWMAPRVVVVGDDKQCTPGEARFSGSQDEVFARLDEHLGDLADDIKLNFTPKSHLYGLLSARSGKAAVVRLREHFRCMPEIINWSSSEFYGGDGGGLVTLRERTAADLEPLRVVQVTGAHTDGRNTKIRNEIEAKRIVAQLAQCLADPRYTDKTFGIVVLQGTGQIRLLEHEINAAISPEVREARKIRVGSAPDFQGGERDVVFLSTVVTDAPRVRKDQVFRQACNVAASRGKDQMWLFTSVPSGGFKPRDLRGSLRDYMQDPPSTYGKSPDLHDVSATERVQPFESLFEQRVFREIKSRGYHIVPQHPVGRRRLDLVVVGDGGRLAVECDGHHWHTNSADTEADGRRDRELRRMGWHVHRIRESEFEFSPERELTPLWQLLTDRGIKPSPGSDTRATNPTWRPIQLPDEDPADDDTLEGDEA